VPLEICLELLAAYFHTPPAFAECQQTLRPIMPD
jgi:hypothetical protein